MAVAISKSIELPNQGGLTVTYWKLKYVNFSLSPNAVTVLMVPFLSQAADDGVKSPAMGFAKLYNLTFAQAGLNTAGNTIGATSAGPYLRDTILAYLLANEPDFSGGSLV